MDNENLSEWFLDKIKSCYAVSNSKLHNHIYLFYDNQYNRCKKLSIIKGNNISVIPNIHNGIFLFDIDTKYDIIYCNYINIWCYIKEKLKYSTDIETLKFIQNSFSRTKMREYTITYLVDYTILNYDDLN